MAATSDWLRTRENRLRSHTAGMDAGSCVLTDNILIDGCTFAGNGSGKHGGAVSLRNSQARLQYSVFSDNTATVGGGAVLNSFAKKGKGGSIATISNSLFYGNTAISGRDVLSMQSAASILSRTAIDGVRLEDGSTLNAVNSIVQQFSAKDSPATISNCSLSQSVPGPRNLGNIVSDPKFVDAAGGDYRLALGSPCIDAGDCRRNTASTDLAGNQRVIKGKKSVQAAVDIGAYEFSPPIEITLDKVSVVDVGADFSIDGTFADSAQWASIWTVTVDFGDGTSGQGKTYPGIRFTSPGHRYATPGDYVITFKIASDVFSSGEASFTIHANDVPSIDIAGQAEILEGADLVRTGAYADLDEVTATMDWGDSSAGAAPLSVRADKTFALRHTYPRSGTYTVTLVVTDS